MELSFQHTLDAEVLDGDDLVFINQPLGQFVDEVGSGVTDGRMSAGDHDTSLRPVLRSLPFLGEATLRSGKPLLTRCEVPGIVDLFPGRQGGQGGEPQVDANLSTARQGFGLSDHSARQEPSAVRLTDHRDGRGLARQGAGPNDAQRFRHLGEPEDTAAEVEARFSKLGRLAAVFRPETRVAGRLAEEIAVGAIKMTKRLLQGNAGNFVQPFKVRIAFPCRQEGAGLLESAPLFADGPCFLPRGSRAIIDDAYATERSIEQGGLLSRRIEAVAKRGIVYHFLFNVVALSYNFNPEPEGALPPWSENQGLRANLLMITGLNIHCADHPTMEVINHNGTYWIEMTSGKPGPHTPTSKVGLFASHQSQEVLQRAVDGFMAAFAPVVAVIEDEPAPEFMEAAE